MCKNLNLSIFRIDYSLKYTQGNKPCIPGGIFVIGM